MPIKSYKDLEVWQQAVELVVACYRVTDALPKTEKFGLASQMQRAAVSVPANIAEGFARQHRKEFLQFLSISAGSLAELETHLHVAVKLGFAAQDAVSPLEAKASQVGRMLNGLMRSIRESRPRTGEQPATGNRRPTTDD